MDSVIRSRFGAAVQQAIDGDCQDWHQEPQTALALVLLLDQFPRHIWRGKAAAFAGDSQGLQLSCLPKAMAGFNWKSGVPGVSSG